MGDLLLNLNEPPNEDGFERYVVLKKDRKAICRTQCLNLPVEMPPHWNISDIVRQTAIHSLSGLPHCFLRPASQNSHEQREWGIFLDFLQKNKKVAVVTFELHEFYILPPAEGSNFSHAVVAYRMEKAHNANDGQKNGITVSNETVIEPTKLICSEALTDTIGTCGFERSSLVSTNTCMNRRLISPSRVETCSRPQPNAVKQDGPLENNFVRADPSYLKTLGQAHSGWIFGAIAELVDNSRDAKAARLDISIVSIYSKKAGKDIPMLSVIDDGHGMTHQEIVRMISFGHKQPDKDDPDHIGRFGIGFKTGAMRLGRDALVLTQTTNSRSIAFLSQTLNGGKDYLEIPIISYRRQGQFMEVDTSVQTEALAKDNLKAVKEYSPFNKYLIGEKAGLFHEKGTGTQIYIWNLDEWGSDYCLEWQAGMIGGSSFHQGDILIRSRRIRSRPGQISQKVPLDYSLRSYLEVIFLDPRMKIYVQGSLVKSRPLAKSLNKTVVENGNVMGKPVQLILGRCQLEWEQANCGIFLYWHGRLIEAYKRVGGMIHNADMGRGVIGVIDVTDVMNDGDGRVWVHSNKQGFQDTEPFARLEEWLGNRSDEYWDKNFDKLQLKKGNALYKPDHEWVQCDKCRRWRRLTSGFDSKNLPQEWFCYMNPFNGKCETPEQKVDRGVITVSTKRSGCNPKQKHVQCEEVVDPVNNSCTSEDMYPVADVSSEGGEEHIPTSLDVPYGNSDGDSGQTVEDAKPPVLKRLRRGPVRFCKKT